MCESNAYIVKDGAEDLIMESVKFLKPEGDKIHLKSIFGEEKTVDATLVEMDLTSQRILLESN